MVNGVLKFEVAANTQKTPIREGGLPPAEDDPWTSAPVSMQHITHILQCQHAFFFLLLHVWCETLMTLSLLILVLH